MHTDSPLQITVLQHVPFEGPVSIATWFQMRGHRVTVVRLWEGERPDLNDTRVLVVMGGPMSVSDTDRHPWLDGELKLIARAIDAGVPTLGVCLGAQLIAASLGAAVFPARDKEIGWWPVEFVLPSALPSAWSRLSRALPARATVMHWHGDTYELPAGATRLAWTALVPEQGFLYGDHVAALQFHLESTASSAASLARASAGDIGRGPWQIAPARAERTMRIGALEHAGATRAILSGILELLERKAR
ncbi:MAG: type 1 glutamine amidotransferase [Spirochaetota bacterium]